MIGTVISRIHRPRTAILHIPGERQFYQRVAARAVQECAYVVPRTKDVVNLLLNTIRLFPIEPDLITALIKPAIPLDHREVAIGCLMIEADSVVFVADCIRVYGAAK